MTYLHDLCNVNCVVARLWVRREDRRRKETQHLLLLNTSKMLSRRRGNVSLWNYRMRCEQQSLRCCDCGIEYCIIKCACTVAVAHNITLSDCVACPFAANSIKFYVAFLFAKLTLLTLACNSVCSSSDFQSSEFFPISKKKILQNSFWFHSCFPNQSGNFGNFSRNYRNFLIISPWLLNLFRKSTDKLRKFQEFFRNFPNFRNFTKFLQKFPQTF